MKNKKMPLIPKQSDGQVMEAVTEHNRKLEFVCSLKWAL